MQCPIAKLRGSEISSTGSSQVDQPATPPQAAPTAWQKSPQCPFPLAQTTELRLPLKLYLVTVTAAKCNMEVARERMAPAAPSDKLKSQNIPPTHSAWQQSSLLPNTAGY